MLSDIIDKDNADIIKSYVDQEIRSILIIFFISICAFVGFAILSILLWYAQIKYTYTKLETESYVIDSNKKILDSCRVYTRKKIKEAQDQK